MFCTANKIYNFGVDKIIETQVYRKTKVLYRKQKTILWNGHNNRNTGFKEVQCSVQQTKVNSLEWTQK